MTLLCDAPKNLLSRFSTVHYNEIPGNLSCENMLSSHVTITFYLHGEKDHRCYFYIINRAFTNASEMVCYFIAAWRYEFSL